MDYRVLGAFEVLDGNGRPLALGPPRARALLGFLVLHANELVATDRLVEELWPAGAPDTAAKVVHVYVSQLRKALGDARGLLATRPPGYVLSVAEHELDLRRFESLLGRAQTLTGAAERRQVLVEALGLWRGDPLAEFAYESFAQPEIARLLELRLLALEARIDVDLELGRSAELVPELEALVAAHPLRERLREQLMLALYRASRQADALAAYRSAQQLLADELGLEPGERLRELERAILRQDPALARAASQPRLDSAEPVRSVLVVPAGAELGALLELAVPLAAVEPARELLLTRVVPVAELAGATELLGSARAELAARGVSARVAAFSSDAPGEDIARLAARQPTDIVLLQPTGQPLGEPVRTVLEQAPCDAAIVLATPGAGPVLVPFGGSEHDWAALELGAWVARAFGRDLRLIGAADAASGGDASRLLADASLVLQLTAGVVAEPLLASPGREGIASLAKGAGLLVVGLSERWRSEGLGAVREELAAKPVAPTVLVRRGIRPGGLAPEHTLTRFTWSIAQGTGR